MALAAKHILLLAAVTFPTDGHVVPPPPCAPHEIFAGRLERSWSERLIGHGVTSAGGLVELWQSEGGATWTLIVTDPRKRTCLVAEGRGWRRLPSGVEL